MTRLFAALAVVSFPVAAVAAPPTTAPIDVNVTNSVLPVEVSNADPIEVTNAATSTLPSDVYTCAAGLSTAFNFVANLCPVYQNVIIQHVSLQATLLSGATDSTVCQARVQVRRDLAVAATLAQVYTRGEGVPTSVSIPTPNIYLNAARDDNLYISLNNTSGVICQVSYVISGVKVSELRSAR